MQHLVILNNIIQICSREKKEEQKSNEGCNPWAIHCIIRNETGKQCAARCSSSSLCRIILILSGKESVIQSIEVKCERVSKPKLCIFPIPCDSSSLSCETIRKLQSHWETRFLLEKFLHIFFFLFYSFLFFHFWSLFIIHSVNVLLGKRL